MDFVPSLESWHHTKQQLSVQQTLPVLCNLADQISAQLKFVTASTPAEPASRNFQYHFSFPRESIPKFQKAFGDPVETKIFSDVFLDTEDSALLHENIWLKRRVKYGVPRLNKTSLKQTALWSQNQSEDLPIFLECKEVLGEHEVFKHLSSQSFIQEKYGKGVTPMVVKQQMTRIIANIRTRRYELKTTQQGIKLYLECFHFDNNYDKFYWLGTVSVEDKWDEASIKDALSKLEPLELITPVRSKGALALHLAFPNEYKKLENKLLLPDGAYSIDHHENPWDPELTERYQKFVAKARTWLKENGKKEHDLGHFILEGPIDEEDEEFL